MDETNEVKDNFLSAEKLLEVRGIKSTAWEDYEQSKVTLPSIGKKYFEPNGSWLEQMQLENGLKNCKRVIELERVDRLSQLAGAEWLPGVQKARVTKKSGQKWDCFGVEEKAQLFLLPEEALILMEMSCLELSWNGMPLSIQQAYEVLINSVNSKCTLDEYRVYSQLIRCGYKVLRYRDKSLSDKSSNTTKRIIMNPDGLWTPNTSPTIDKQSSDSNGSSSTSKNNSEQEDDTKSNRSENSKSPKPQRLGIVSEETVLGNIKIVKNSDAFSTANQTNKWPGSRIQRNVKLMPKRCDKVNHTNNFSSELTDVNCPQNIVPEKRRNSNSSSTESSPMKKPRPEVIELSDDEIEEIPRPLTRAEILNTFPNINGSSNEPLIVEISRAYLPYGVKPVKDFYRFDRQRLLNLSKTDSELRSNRQLESVSSESSRHNNHFYSQRSQCQSITTYNSNNGYSYRGMRCQRDGGSYIQQNVLHNTIHTPYSGTFFQSSVNFVMEVMGNMVRSFRQQQFQQTTYCPNVQLYSPRYQYQQQRYQPYNMNYYNQPVRDHYYRRGSNMPAITSQKGGRMDRYNSNDILRTVYSTDEPNIPSFTKRSGVVSWSELKRKWREESTITIEDEEPTPAQGLSTNDEVQVVEESISPLINSKSSITNISEVYDRLRIIKSATDKTVRSRKVDYTLSYEVFPINQHFRKSCPGTPMCRLFVINSKKESSLDASKLQRLQQESKEVPIVVAFVSQSCISYIQPGVVLLPNLS